MCSRIAPLTADLSVRFSKEGEKIILNASLYSKLKDYANGLTGSEKIMIGKIKCEK